MTLVSIPLKEACCKYSKDWRAESSLEKSDFSMQVSKKPAVRVAAFYKFWARDTIPSIDSGILIVAPEATS